MRFFFFVSAGEIGFLVMDFDLLSDETLLHLLDATESLSISSSSFSNATSAPSDCEKSLI
jgi:hypothetical protein